ncbi:MAG: heat-inducible transcription repressor HrcA [bacterium]|nr:MAG: heat-inducible transcription repressor HrcA [bacterium]
MVPGKDLTEYESELLKDLVSLYIREGKPVSSKALKGSFELDTSTANIRKMLHRLEEKGYLYKPHISAGRIPSDLAYRYYVNDIKSVKALDIELVEAIRRRIGQDWDDIRDVMTQTSKLLGELTNYMGLIMGIFSTSVIIERLRIIQLEGTAGLVVLTLFPGVDKHVHIDFSKRYSPYILDRAEQMINERITGHTLEEATPRLKAFVRESIGLEREIVETINAEADTLFEWPYDLKYYFKGSNEQIELFELNNLRILQRLVRLMGEEGLMRQVLQRRMDHDFLITIGRENEVEELEDFSIITHRFTTGTCAGLLGILGPMRMSYNLVLSLLDRMAEELHRLDWR